MSVSANLLRLTIDHIVAAFFFFFFIMPALFVYLGLKLKIVRMMKTCLSHWIGMKFSFTKSAPKCRDEYLDTNYDDKDP